MNSELKIILNLVANYAKKHKTKTWKRGEFVHYAGEWFDEKEYVAATEALLTKWLILDSNGSEFESKFPERLGKDYGLLTNSGSSSNLLALEGLKKGFNLPLGTKVITTAASFPTTVNPIIQVGFKPVLVDSEINTLNIDLDQVEQQALDGARVLFFAHALGNPPDMERLMRIVKNYHLLLIEDCCDALGSTYNGQLLGSFGILATSSFYPAHHMTMGEGGFVASNDKRLISIIRSFRDWGRACHCSGINENKLKDGVCGKRFSKWLSPHVEEEMDHKYMFTNIGYNMKPIEIQAAMGLQQMNKLDEMTRRRKENYQLLYDIFEKYEKYFILPKATPNSDPAWFAFPLTVKPNSLFTRTEFTKKLEESKIQTRNYFAGNLLNHPAYTSLRNDKIFPVADQITSNTFFLGTSPVITQEQIKYIKEIVDNTIIYCKLGMNLLY
jgi:CDP-4-dehydro-6-deoxyglucose reductase, E1